MNQDTELINLVQNIRIVHYTVSWLIIVQNTTISNEKVLCDSVILKSELGRFGRKMKISHTLH
mgnify:CR=1 FL=1